MEIKNMPTRKPVKKVSTLTVVDYATKSINSITTELNTLQTNMRESVNKLTEAFVTKKEELDKLTESVETRKKELADSEECFNIEDKLFQLQEDLKKEQINYENILNKLEREYADRKFELERDEKNYKIQKKDEENNQDKKRAWDVQDEVRERMTQYNEREKALDERESQIAKKETELGDFDTKVKAEVAKAVNAIKSNHSHELKLLETQKIADINTLQARYDSLLTLNHQQKERIEDLEEDIQELMKRTTAMATAAIDAESNKKALEKLEQVMHEQAKGAKK